jgi:4-hydroxyisophthalate hydroxylase
MLQTSMNNLANQYDVVVIGAGPVGTGLAIDLAQRGRNVCLVEKYEQPQRIPKGQNLTQRTGEHLRRWSVSSEIRAATLIPPEFGNRGITAYGSWLSGWHYDWFKRASVREYYFADNERLPQYETERVLRERAAKLDCLDLITGWSYVSHVDGDESSGVQVELQPTDGNGEAQSLSGSWLVGCDGARSPVRECAGITQSIDAHERRMALVTFRSTQLDALLEDRFPGRTIFNAIHPDLNGYWQFLGRTSLDSQFFFHAPVAENSTFEGFDFAGLLQRAAGVEVSAELEHVGFWDLRFAQADSYRSGRVFVAGDAAHSHPPYGGYGVNLGFEDVRNLAWKLDAWLEGWGSEALLDSYNTERHPVFASTRDHFIARMIHDDADFTARFDPSEDKAAFEAEWQRRAEDGQAEVALYVPNYAGSPIVVGEASANSGAVAEHGHSAMAGFHLTPQPVGTGAELFTELGQGFTLIALDASDEALLGFVATADALGVPLKLIRGGVNDDNARWGATLILVRPDEYIAWTGDSDAANSPPNSAEVLHRAIGA